MLRKFGLRSYDQFCGSLALCSTIAGKHDFDSYNSRTYLGGHWRGLLDPKPPRYICMSSKQSYRCLIVFNEFVSFKIVDFAVFGESSQIGYFDN